MNPKKNKILYKKNKNKEYSINIDSSDDKFNVLINISDIIGSSNSSSKKNKEYSINIDSSDDDFDDSNNVDNIIDKIINRKKYLEKIVSDEERDYYNDCKKYNTSYIPSVLPNKDRIIVLGDIHGDYNVLIKMLKAGNLIDDNENWIGGNTYVVQVGDQIDRCRPKGDYPCNHEKGTDNDESSDIRILKLFTKLDKQATNSNGRVISLLGNHELMNVQGHLAYVSYKGLQEFENYKDPKNIKKEFKSGEEARHYAFLPGNEYGEFLGCTRLGAVIIGEHLFVHAGIIPYLVNDLQIENVHDFETINFLIRKWLIGNITADNIDKIINSKKTSMFWTRILGNIPINKTMDDEVCQKYLEPVLEILKIGSIIIGHTPQSFMKFGGINGTCDNHLWRVDNGSSGAFDKFDDEFVSFNKISATREPQVLEIKTKDNKSEYKVLIYKKQKDNYKIVEKDMDDILIESIQN
jgi:hypothetical protein